MNNILRKYILIILGTLLSAPVWSQGPPVPDTMSNPLAQVLVIIIGALAVSIIILANIVKSAAGMYREKMRKEKEAQSSTSNTIKPLLLLLIFGGFGMAMPAIAQTAPTDNQNIVQNINGLSPFTFYMLITIIGLEIIVLLALIYQLKFLMGLEKVTNTQATSSFAQKVGSWNKVWWEKINTAKPIDKEDEIDLKHNYDGIRELDNPVPPWWRWAFIFTILFGFAYLWRYHVAKSVPLQAEEFAIAMQKAETEKEAYLKKAANNVDEKTVVMLDANGIAAGKGLFIANCTPCHGQHAEGASVGPNLTDDYWIHGGKINDVFKSIKYGWQEKGMRSWKEDFSPVQLAQLASFIKSLKGSNPPNSKAPQGELYVEEAVGNNSPQKSEKDSTNHIK